nr:MAG TPA: hypothetical protein [Caudoviricetes sp.]
MFSFISIRLFYQSLCCLSSCKSSKLLKLIKLLASSFISSPPLLVAFLTLHTYYNKKAYPCQEINFIFLIIFLALFRFFQT